MRKLIGISVVALTVILVMVASQSARAQDEHRNKMPVVGKITGGSNRQAFSGKVQSLDLKKNLLMVDTVEGGSTEYFPLKRTVTITSAGGGRRRIDDLTPGMNVIVYYEVKDDRRNVSQIVLLGTGKAEETKKSNTPPS